MPYQTYMLHTETSLHHVQRKQPQCEEPLTCLMHVTDNTQYRTQCLSFRSVQIKHVSK